MTHGKPVGNIGVDFPNQPDSVFQDEHCLIGRKGALRKRSARFIDIFPVSADVAH